MVSKDDIRSLDFVDITEYYEYILDSNTNGQLKQARELYLELSEKQKKAFEKWYLNFYHYDVSATDTSAHEELCNIINLLEN